MRSTSLFTFKRIGLRMSTTLSSEDICLYEYMESIGGRKFEMQARTVKWGGQKCCCDHKIWLVGERRQNLLDVSESSKHFTWIPSCREEVKPWSCNGLAIPVIYRFYGQEKLVNWLIKKIEAIKKELECKVSKCLK